MEKTRCEQSWTACHEQRLSRLGQNCQHCNDCYGRPLALTSQQLSSHDLRFRSLWQLGKKPDHRKRVVFRPDLEIAVRHRREYLCLILYTFSFRPWPSGFYPLSFSLYPFKYDSCSWSENYRVRARNLWLTRAGETSTV